MAQWTAKYMDELPDSSFAYVEPGGKKDAAGKTVPRAKRHFPLRDQNGKLDRDHVADAASRAPDSPFGAKAMGKIRAAERALKMGKFATASSLCAVSSVLPEGPAPEWIELVPTGEVETHDARGPYVLDDPQAVIARSMAQCAGGVGLLIDYDHATDLGAPHGAPAPAAGWITALEVRAGAIWGKVAWTARGAQAVGAKEWRFISPVLQLSGKDKRVLFIARAGLTNNPNLYMTAISAKETAPMAEMEPKEFLNRMAEVHGLDADASEGDVLNAARARKAAHDKHHASADEARQCEDAGGPADPDNDGDDDGGDGDGGGEENAMHRLIASGKVVSQTDHARLVTEVNALKTANARKDAEGRVDALQRERKLTPAQREWAINYCAGDPRGFAKFAATLAPILDAADRTFELKNKDGAAQGALTASELEICSRMGLAPEEFLKTRKQPVSVEPGRN